MLGANEGQYSTDRAQCDSCSKNGPVTDFMSCRSCHVDLCARCYKLAVKAKKGGSSGGGGKKASKGTQGNGESVILKGRKQPSECGNSYYGLYFNLKSLNVPVVVKSLTFCSLNCPSQHTVWTVTDGMSIALIALITLTILRVSEPANLMNIYIYSYDSPDKHHR